MSEAPRGGLHAPPDVQLHSAGARHARAAQMRVVLNASSVMGAVMFSIANIWGMNLWSGQNRLQNWPWWSFVLVRACAARPSHSHACHPAPAGCGGERVWQRAVFVQQAGTTFRFPNPGAVFALNTCLGDMPAGWRCTLAVWEAQQSPAHRKRLAVSGCGVAARRAPPP